MWSKKYWGNTYWGKKYWANGKPLATGTMIFGIITIPRPQGPPCFFGMESSIDPEDTGMESLIDPEDTGMISNTSNTIGFISIIQDTLGAISVIDAENIGMISLIDDSATGMVSSACQC